MFETRVKVMLAVLAFGAVIIITRLFDMQVVHGGDYRAQAHDALQLPAKTLPAVRGRILDRSGRELVSDEPCWEIQVHYDALAIDTTGVGAWYRRAPKETLPTGDVTAADKERWFRERVDAMWDALADFSGDPEIELRGRGGQIVDRVARIREQVARRRTFDSPVREENMRHAVLTGLDDQQQVAARQRFAEWPWVSVEDATQRVYHAGPAFAHLLGQIGPVTDEIIAGDPFARDPYRAYRDTDRCGLTGVERVAENRLRGARGSFQTNRRGAILEDVKPVAGGDVHLTIRADLQEALYELFAGRIEELPQSTGGALVVLDVPSRDCLAMISYPGYDPARFQENYPELRDDTRRLPLRFRAVANQYAPGSIVKPLVCLAGLDSGRLTLDTHFECQGSLFPEYPDRWRCWPNYATGQRMRHGALDVVGAIKHSCNVFMYNAGETLGVERLTAYFDMVGFGHVTSTGLIEETSGINPVPTFLMDRDQSPTAGHARNFAIGQGEVAITPVQAANLMAVYASGEYRHVNLVEELRDDLRWTLPGTDPQWQAIRKGLYGVVNDSDGTAHKYAYVGPECGYAIFGKTGSAEVMNPWVVSYAIPYVDAYNQEDVAIVHASTLNEAIEKFAASHHPDCAFSYRDIRVAETWPPERLAESGRLHSHAWFAGYLHPVDAAGRPIPGRTPPIAFAVLVEFGGSGGRVSAPIGREVALKIIEMLGPDLNSDARSVRMAGAAARRTGRPGGP